MLANKASVTFLLLFCCVFFCGSHGGSHCPPREDLYPCICINKSIGKKKVETTLVCHALQSPTDFVAIETTVLSMNIDKFLLYDSFWERDSSQRNQMSMQTNPLKFMNSYEMKEVEIVDTILPLLPCTDSLDCSRLAVTRLTAINSSSPSRYFAVTCPSWTNRLTSWINCFSTLKYLKVCHGNLKTLKIGQTFGIMKELREFNLSYNEIETIEDRTFGIAAFPKLRVLDLSHNNFRNVKNIFSSEMKIEFLDVSYNPLRSIPNLQQLPKLKTLKISNSRIANIFPADWAGLPKPLRNIDLTGNSINCDCSIKWINSTFHINTNFIGACERPTQVAKMKIRQASRYLIERCNENNEIGSKSKASKRNK